MHSIRLTYQAQRGFLFFLTVNQGNDGTTYEKYTTAPKGSSENPLSDEEVKEKFKTTSGLSPTIAEEVIEKVMRLEEVRSVIEILSLI